MRTVLSIAGSDCSGGAGIQADLKTFIFTGVYGMSAITALTAQNTTGVTDIMNVSDDFLKSQLDAIFTDIFPDSVKIGMVSDPGQVKTIYEALSKYRAKKIVVDPVMVATSGSILSNNETVELMEKLVFPIATLITPNIPEAEHLSGEKISDEKDMEKVGIRLYEKYDTNILIKGGHGNKDANDCLIYEGEVHWCRGERINNENTHGTGCTLSSAIASFLAQGNDLKEAVYNGKKYVETAISAGLNLGKGRGPINHAVRFK